MKSGNLELNLSQLEESPELGVTLKVFSKPEGEKRFSCLLPKVRLVLQQPGW